MQKSNRARSPWLRVQGSAQPIAEDNRDLLLWELRTFGAPPGDVNRDPQIIEQLSLTASYEIPQVSENCR